MNWSARLSSYTVLEYTIDKVLSELVFNIESFTRSPIVILVVANGATRPASHPVPSLLQDEKVPIKSRNPKIRQNVLIN